MLMIQSRQNPSFCLYFTAFNVYLKVALARAARTDAGVHAAGNIVSLKMIMHVPGIPDLVGRVNELLPPEIRLWGYVRAQNSFNARLFVQPLWPSN